MSYKKGDTVTVHNQTMGGRPIVEGEARVVRALGENRYLVRFVNHADEGTFERYVSPPEAKGED